MSIISDQIVVENQGERLREQYDHRSPLRVLVDAVASIGREIEYFAKVRYHRFMHTHDYTQKIEWQKDTQGLVVLLHGLRNSPDAWFAQLSHLRKYRQIDVFAPTVPFRGMCSLDEAATPLLPTILDYAQKNPGKPICLLGVSNGSRIVMWLDPKLRDQSPQTPVMISNIAGVHLGSRQMNKLEITGIAKWLYPEALRNELQYGSSKAKELLSQVAAPLPEGCASRRYEFYATTEDTSVPDLDSALPKLNKGEACTVLHGQSHNSIVSAVAERQINSCIQWINTFNSAVMP